MKVVPKLNLGGTPNNISAQQLKDEFILVLCFLPERYE